MCLTEKVPVRYARLRELMVPLVVGSVLVNQQCMLNKVSSTMNTHKLKKKKAYLITKKTKHVNTHKTMVYID